MIRGLTFTISQEIKYPLSNILSGVNTEEYSWFCVPNQEEIWNSKRDAPFFDKTDYTGKEFSNLLKLDCYIIFLKLQAYHSKNKYCNIHSYEDFLISDCQLLLLIYDCESVEIYCKNEDTSKTLYNNAINQKFSDVMYITDSNDIRYKFDIL